MMKDKKPEKCKSCNKSSGFDGCSRIECSKRKPLTASYSRIANAMDMQDGHRRTSKKYLNEE